MDEPEREKRRKRKRGACIDPHGYEAGKKRQRRRCAEIKGKKRHTLVDTLGLLLHAIVHPADIQDRDGGVLVMATLFGMFPFLKTLFADSGYQGPKFAKAAGLTMPEGAKVCIIESEFHSDFGVGIEVRDPSKGKK